MKAPQQARAQKTRERILDAAETVFETTGYAKTRMGAIAKAAGLSTGGLYEWFANKEEVLTGIGERHVERITAAVAFRLAADAPSDLESLARAILEPALALHRAHPRLHHFLYGEAPRPPALQRLVETVGAAIEKVIANHLAETDDAGRVRRAALIYRAGESLLHTYVLDVSLPGSLETRRDELITALLALSTMDFRSPPEQARKRDDRSMKFDRPGKP